MADPQLFSEDHPSRRQGEGAGRGRQDQQDRRALQHGVQAAGEGRQDRLGARRVRPGARPRGRNPVLAGRQFDITTAGRPKRPCARARDVTGRSSSRPPRGSSSSTSTPSSSSRRTSRTAICSVTAPRICSGSGSPSTTSSRTTARASTSYVEQILEKRVHFIGERRHRRKDGSLVDVEVSSSVISYGGGEALCVIVHDITERKRSAERLQRSLDALLGLYEAGQILSSSLQREEIGSRLLEIASRVSNLTAAVISIPDEEGELRIWRSSGLGGTVAAGSLRPRGRGRPPEGAGDQEVPGRQAARGRRMRTSRNS